MGNSKRFLLAYNNNNNVNASIIVDIVKNDLCNKTNIISNPKFITYLHYFSYIMILPTGNNTYWDVDKLTDYVKKKLEEKRIFSGANFFFIDVTGSSIQGWMSADFWKDLQKYSDLEKFIENRDRSLKLKKIKKIVEENEMIKKKEEELKRKEQELKKKEEDYQKEMERVKMMEELKKKEEELKKKEEDIDKKIDEMSKKKKWFGIF